MRFPVAVVALALVGCGAADPGDLPLSSTAGESYEAFRDRVYSEVEADGTEVFVVDWDTPIRGEAALRAWFAALQDGALAIATNQGADVTWSATQRHALTYCIANSFGERKPAVAEAMAKATNGGWESFADVNWDYLPNQDGNCTAENQAVVFDIQPANSGGSYLARSFYPDDPRSQRTIHLDASAFDLQQTGGIPLENVLAHELGHIIGFRHEHIRPEAMSSCAPEDSNYRGVTPYDPVSVMHYPQCGGEASLGSVLAFTTLDMQGVASVYGPPATNMPPTAQWIFPAEGATVARTFKAQATFVDTDMQRGELLVDGQVVQSLAAPPWIFEVRDQVDGPHVIEIRATDFAGHVTTNDAHVTVAVGGATGDLVGLGGGDVEGGCNVGAGSGGLAVAALALRLRRRRRRHARQ